MPTAKNSDFESNGMNKRNKSRASRPTPYTSKGGLHYPTSKTESCQDQPIKPDDTPHMVAKQPLPGTEELLARLAPRDIEVIRGLIQYDWLPQRDVSKIIGMGFYNLCKRRQRVYAVLGVTSRINLYSRFHHLFLEEQKAH